jgi:hypothetical protein
MATLHRTDLGMPMKLNLRATSNLQPGHAPYRYPFLLDLLHDLKNLPRRMPSAGMPLGGMFVFQVFKDLGEMTDNKAIEALRFGTLPYVLMEENPGVWGNFNPDPNSSGDQTRWQ